MGIIANVNLQFYHLTELFVTAIGAFLLFAIWKSIRNRFRQKLEEDENQIRIDRGLLYISLALLVWVVKGLLLLLAPELSPMMSRVTTEFFSLLNSLFFVLALFYFDNAPKFLYRHHKNVKIIIGLFAVISIVSLLLFVLFDATANHQLKVSSIPDLIISAILTYLLTYSFYFTFKKRHLQLLAYFSVVTFVVMFLAQLPDILGINTRSMPVDLIRIISKSALISLCLMLATSWVMALAETPLSSEMFIYFKDWSLVELTIPSKSINKEVIDFKGKHTQFRNLLKFAVRRKFALADEQYIEILRGNEIPEQVYLTRILKDINACLKDSPANRNDLFTFIGQGRYRLRFVSDNIKIDEALLHEFTESSENSNYKAMVEANVKSQVVSI